MISCKEVAGLLMSDQLREAGRWKRFEVRMHLAMCRHCSRLARQIAEMARAARSRAQAGEPRAGFEERIRERLSRDLH
jgi:predicted anti-sigma-YlaC factor YlaD